MDYYEDELNRQIGFEEIKDLSGAWTEEYRGGYVDGLKRALEVYLEGRKEENVNDWIAEFLERNKGRFVDQVEDREVVGHEVGVILEKVRDGLVKLD